MTPTELQQLLDVLARSAPTLREAGVASVAVNGVEATFAPHYPADVPAQTSTADEDDEGTDFVPEGWVRPENVTVPDDYDPTSEVE